MNPNPLGAVPDPLGSWFPRPLCPGHRHPLGALGAILDPRGAIPDPNPAGARFPLGARRGGIDPRRDGAIHGGAAQSINRASGSMGAGEGRSEVGRWPGGITNPL